MGASKNIDLRGDVISFPENNDPLKKLDAEAFYLKEIAWREFAYHLAYHTPQIETDNWRSEWNAFPWKGDCEDAEKWRQGQTGEPLIDAAMRELYITGKMHNRARMLVASYLTKHLLIDWRIGKEWFEETLIDWDPASNAMGWQWVAGSGPDAAPYFRIFNPLLQADKFEAAEYIRKYVPELANLSDKFISKPWEAKADILEEAKIELGKDYPHVIVDLKASREKALALHKKLK